MWQQSSRTHKMCNTKPFAFWRLLLLHYMKMLTRSEVGIRLPVSFCHIFAVFKIYWPRNRDLSPYNCASARCVAFSVVFLRRSYIYSLFAAQTRTGSRNSSGWKTSRHTVFIPVNKYCLVVTMRLHSTALCSCVTLTTSDLKTYPQDMTWTAFFTPALDFLHGVVLDQA